MSAITSDAADHHDHSDEFHLFLRDVPAGGRSINDSDVSAHDGVYPGRTDPVPPDLPEGIDDPGKQHVYAALDQHDYSDETERVKGYVQYKILAASTLLCFIIPVIVRKGKFLKNLTWIYAVLGIAMLSVVMVLGFTSGGAKLSIEIHGITFQLSEIAKITLVFFMAGMLREDNSFGNVVKATVIAAFMC